MNRVFILLVVLMAGAAASAQSAKVVVFPIEAIADSAELSRSQFHKRYPGIDITELGLLDEGWYVRYTHELLTYVYGPIEDLDEARRQKKLLEEIRLNLVLKNPKLSASQVDLIEFRFDGSSSQTPYPPERSRQSGQEE